jgi:hypothetical protein
VTLAVGPALATPVRGAEGALPTIVAVTTPPRLVTGAALDFGIVYRAPQANVVAVDQTVEDLDGPLVQRTTRQRRVSVVAQAFGREAGELRMTVAFRALPAADDSLSPSSPTRATRASRRPSRSTWAADATRGIDRGPRLKIVEVEGIIPSVLRAPRVSR